MNQGKFFVKCALLGLIALSLVGFITMVLWNWLVPVLFNGPVINYFQALGLLLLSKILSWGFFQGKRQHHHFKESTPYWKQRFYEKFSSMSPHEREAFKEKMKAKWCNWEKDSSKTNSPSSND